MIGFVVMGCNFVFNIESCGYVVLVFNCSCEKIDELIVEFFGCNLVLIYMFEEFVVLFEVLCWILMMVKVGEVIDVMIVLFKLLFEKGDVLIDGGNMYFIDMICCN